MSLIVSLSHPHQGLKNHAVTMFEVGKLTDESLDSFLVELGKVRSRGHAGLKESHSSLVS